jgi:hypothetical protein
VSNLRTFFASRIGMALLLVGTYGLSSRPKNSFRSTIVELEGRKKGRKDMQCNGSARATTSNVRFACQARCGID